MLYTHPQLDGSRPDEGILHVGDGSSIEQLVHTEHFTAAVNNQGDVFVTTPHTATSSSRRRRRRFSGSVFSSSRGSSTSRGSPKRTRSACCACVGRKRASAAKKIEHHTLESSRTLLDTIDDGTLFNINTERSSPRLSEQNLVEEALYKAQQGGGASLFEEDEPPRTNRTVPPTFPLPGDSMEDARRQRAAAKSPKSLRRSSRKSSARHSAGGGGGGVVVPRDGTISTQQSYLRGQLSITEYVDKMNWYLSEGKLTANEHMDLMRLQYENSLIHASEYVMFIQQHHECGYLDNDNYFRIMNEELMKGHLTSDQHMNLMLLKYRQLHMISPEEFVAFLTQHCQSGYLDSIEYLKLMQEELASGTINQQIHQLYVSSLDPKSPQEIPFTSHLPPTIPLPEPLDDFPSSHRTQQQPTVSAVNPPAQLPTSFPLPPLPTPPLDAPRPAIQPTVLQPQGVTPLYAPPPAMPPPSHPLLPAPPSAMPAPSHPLLPTPPSTMPAPSHPLLPTPPSTMPAPSLSAAAPPSHPPSPVAPSPPVLPTPTHPHAIAKPYAPAAPSPPPIISPQIPFQPHPPSPTNHTGMYPDSTPVMDEATWKRRQEETNYWTSSTMQRQELRPEDLKPRVVSERNIGDGTGKSVDMEPRVVATNVQLVGGVRAASQPPAKMEWPEMQVTVERRRDKSCIPAIRESRVIQAYECGERTEVDRRVVRNEIVSTEAAAAYRELLIQRYGAENVAVDNLGEYIVKKIEIPQLEVQTREVRVKERRENVITKPTVVVETREKLVEVPEISYVETEKQVPYYVTKTVVKRVPQVIDRPVEKTEYVKIYQDVVREEIREVPGPIVEIPCKYIVNRPVIVPRYVDRKVPVVVAQSFWPNVFEDDENSEACVDVDCRAFRFKTIHQDVYLPLLVERSLLFKELKIEHREVQPHLIPDPQYNALVRALNPTLQHSDAKQLFRYLNLRTQAAYTGDMINTPDGPIPIVETNLGTQFVPLSDDMQVLSTSQYKPYGRINPRTPYMPQPLLSDSMVHFNKAAAIHKQLIHQHTSSGDVHRTRGENQGIISNLRATMEPRDTASERTMEISSAVLMDNRLAPTSGALIAGAGRHCHSLINNDDDTLSSDDNQEMKNLRTHPATNRLGSLLEWVQSCVTDDSEARVLEVKHNHGLRMFRPGRSLLLD